LYCYNYKINNYHYVDDDIFGKKELIESQMTTEIKDLDFDPNSKRRPSWAADNSKEQCTKCGAGFTAFNRRHHCR
jgi:hypothetical protein